jgi:hypothetical protein
MERMKIENPEKLKEWRHNAYMNRKRVTGHGNKVTTDDKEKIVSCIYKDDLQE